MRVKPGQSRLKTHFNVDSGVVVLVRGSNFSNMVDITSHAGLGSTLHSYQTLVLSNNRETHGEINYVHKLVICLKFGVVRATKRQRFDSLSILLAKTDFRPLAKVSRDVHERCLFQPLAILISQVLFRPNVSFRRFMRRRWSG